MAKIIFSIFCLLSLSFLTGCGSSSPINYYVLSSPSTSPPAGTSPIIGVGTVTIPEYLNRENMVFNSEENALFIADSDRWAEPLQKGIQRVLAMNLASLLDTQNIRLHPWARSAAPDYSISVNVLRLDANDKEATLAAEWQIIQTTEQQPRSRNIKQISQSFIGNQPDADDIAAAYSVLLFQLSETIAAAIEAELREP